MTAAMYKVLARKYRPQIFKEILGQDALVLTLRNSIKQQRLAHAYLFSGPRGTGKTTTARIFAKALNCRERDSEGEPCNTCPSCLEIAAGNSLDVLEIDGASHRGIEDVRQINETVGYASASGGYKIYIIDEVHMLTKEAFNALLKTLEEPPPKVLFFFATTEPHKVPSTILSRCQRFHLHRIPNPVIIGKLHQILQDLGVEAEEEALKMVANLSEGGLRDAESLLDQVLAFQEGTISPQVVSSVLGLATSDAYFALDQAGTNGDITEAYRIADEIFSQGKDVSYFLAGLIDHVRNILLVKIATPDAPYLHLTETEKEKYAASSALYTKEQCLTLLDRLLEAQQKIRFVPSQKTFLESTLLQVIRIHQQIPIESLVRKLCELEKKYASPSTPKKEAAPPASKTEDPTPKKEAPPPSSKTEDPTPKKEAAPPASKTEDPTPKKEEIPPTKPKKGQPPKKIEAAEQNRYDTVMQFAAIELEGSVTK